MLRKDRMNRSREEIFEDYLYQQFIYEEKHIYMTCGDAITGISKQIQDEYRTKSGQSKTGWYFMPDKKECT